VGLSACLAELLRAVQVTEICEQIMLKSNSCVLYLKKKNVSVESGPPNRQSLHASVTFFGLGGGIDVRYPPPPIYNSSG
jgi:hypothetical protein